LFFSFDIWREGVTPEAKRLRAYSKIWLEPKESQTVEVHLPIDDFRFVGPHSDTHYVLQDGLTFRIGVGPDVDCRSDTDADKNNDGDGMCTDSISIQTEHDYVGACEAACNVWHGSGCSHSAMSNQPKCRSECYKVHSDPTSSLNNDGWGWNYVDCLEAIVFESNFDPQRDCAKLTTLCRNVLTTQGVDEFGNGMGSSDIVSNEIQPWTLGLALFAGVFASVAIMLAMNGGCDGRGNVGRVERQSPGPWGRKTDEQQYQQQQHRRHGRASSRGDIQFSAISTSEGEYA
jgi:hypothetical protein